MSHMTVEQAICEVFNAQNPVGSKVWYIDDDGCRHETTVKASAEVLSEHTPVVWLAGVRGAYQLSRVIGGTTAI